MSDLSRVTAHEVPGSLAQDPTPSDRVELLIVCTGNAARSVMVGYMIEHLARETGRSISITTAGTHTIDGQPMGMRTRAALVAIPELAAAPVSAHRSHQVAPADIDRADLVVAMEADHVRYLRRHFPGAASRTATMRRLARDLAKGPEPLDSRLRALELDRADVTDDEDVADPAGGDAEVYLRCSEELWTLSQELMRRL